jgi:hypothetical protein
MSQFWLGLYYTLLRALFSLHSYVTNRGNAFQYSDRNKPSHYWKQHTAFIKVNYKSQYMGVKCLFGQAS